MVHLATAELDSGPVVAYCSFPIVGLRYDRLWHTFRKQRDALGLDGVVAAEGERQPLFAEIRRQGERREIPLLYHTVREFALEHLLMRDGEIVGVTLDPPLELTAEVDAKLAADEHAELTAEEHAELTTEKHGDAAAEHGDAAGSPG